MMFLDCPAYLDHDGAARCGLPAEVRCWFTMGSSKEPIENAMIRCLADHWFNWPVEFLTWQDGHQQGPDVAAVAPNARRNSRTRGRDGCGASGTSDHLISAVASGYQPSDTALPTRRYGPPPALDSRAACARVPGSIGITMRRPRMRNRSALPG
jgi:hypothetical protein